MEGNSHWKPVGKVLFLVLSVWSRILAQDGTEIVLNAIVCLPQLWLTCLYFHLSMNQEFKNLARSVQSPLQNLPALAFGSELPPHLFGLGKSLDYAHPSLAAWTE